MAIVVLGMMLMEGVARDCQEGEHRTMTRGANSITTITTYSISYTTVECIYLMHDFDVVYP